ncbi:MAG: hypothetical protein ACREON_05790 [Gemmatimonadaceae bacterium]
MFRPRPLPRFVPAVLALAMLAAPAARAQELAAARLASHTDSVSSASAVGEMRARLRRLVSAQEAFLATHGAYTTDLAALGLVTAGGHVPRDSIWLQVVHAGGRSWTARAMYRLRDPSARASCVIFVGDPHNFPSRVATDRVGAYATDEGVPLCDH